MRVVEGDLLDQKVDFIVNSWNRNIIPWWMLIPQGVSGSIKKKAGLQPFKELSRFGPINLGGARLTSAGNLPFKGIFHVAGINMFWIATRYSISQSVLNVMKAVNEKGIKSIGFPIIGSGSGNRSSSFAMEVMIDTFSRVNYEADVLLVKFCKEK